MAFKTSSKQKTSASSAVSSSSSGGVAISQVYITDASYVNSDDTAIGTSGGYLKLVGSGFVTGCVVYVNNAAVTTTFVSSSEVRAVIPSAAAGTYSLTIFNTNSGGSIWASGLAFSGFPTVTTSSYTSTLGAVVNTQIVATGDGTLSYSLQGGSTLPTGVTLSSTGLVSGTATGISANTVVSFTVLVNDSQNQTVQQAITISLIFGDIYFKNVTALLSGDTFTNVTDSSTNKFALTAAGSPVASNLTPFNSNYSIYNSGAASGGGTINVAGTGGIFGSSTSYTIEGWFYFTAASTGDNQNIVATNTNTYPTRWVFDTAVTATSLQLRLVTETNAVAFTGTAVTMSPLNTWVHLAVVNNVAGNACTFYINGVAAGTRAAVSLVSYATLNLFYNSQYITTAAPFYVSNFRIVSGTAVYTANFTPSTSPLTAITNTSLLTFQDNRIKDNSTNAFAITASGTQVSQRTPFEITPSVTLGSTNFNGGSQYMTVPANAAHDFGTSDFTVEFWLYCVTAWTSMTNPGIAGKKTSDSTGGWQIYKNGDNNLDRMNIRISGTNDYPSTLGPATGVWEHWAVVRSSGTLTWYRNGVAAGSYTGVTANITDAASLNIGRTQFWNGYFNGYISNLRIVKGTAVYTANFTPSTTPLTAIANTSLLTLQSPVASNNNTFLDSSPNTLAVTRVGTPTQGSVGPFGSNWSNYFDGTGDYLSIATNAAFEFGSGDFTVECWINPLAFDSTDGGFMGIGPQLGSATWILRGAADGSLTFTAWSSGGTVGAAFNTAASALPFNTWSHVAVTRNGSTWNIWVNGTSVATTTNSSTIGNTGRPAYISYSYSSNAGRYQNCYISNVRWVKGTAVYTSAFTPSTTPLTAIANTSLLTCQSNRFKDNSTNNFVVTKNGDTVVSRYSPFSTTTGYVPAIHGGSMYFNGSTDYLTTPFNTLFVLESNDFTVEAWVYRNAAGVEHNIALTRSVAGSDGWNLRINATNTLQFYYNAGTSISSTGTIPLNTWTHVAATRNGTAGKLFINGVVDGTATFANGTATTLALRIGVSATNAAGYFNGYISDLRIVKGTAVYTAAFTPSTTPLTAVTNTALLLNGTNAGVVDHTMLSNYNTVGDSRITSSQFKYGTGSMYFDGTGDYLLTPTSPIFSFGTGDFTVESWVRFATLGANRMIADCWVSGGAGAWQLYYSNGSTKFAFYVNAGTVLASTTTPAVNTWYHVAVTRSGSTIRMFVNGVSEASATYTVSLNHTQPFAVGMQYSTVTNALEGHIDDLRITKGIARYTANFTPEAQAFLKN